MSVSRKPLRYAVLGLPFAAGLVFAPASACARPPWPLERIVELRFPGVAVGYSNYGWGGYGGYYGSYHSPGLLRLRSGLLRLQRLVVYRSAYYDRPPIVPSYAQRAVILPFAHPHAPKRTIGVIARLHSLVPDHRLRWRRTLPFPAVVDAPRRFWLSRGFRADGLYLTKALPQHLAVPGNLSGCS